MISIVIPAYNNSDKIERILKKLYKNERLEILIVDDGSNFLESEKLRKFRDEYHVKYIVQSNMGPSVARLNGFNQASYDYVLFLDADDMFDFHEFDYSMLNNDFDYYSFGSRYFKDIDICDNYNVNLRPNVLFRESGKLIFLFNQFGCKSFWNSSNTIYKKSSIVNIFKPNNLRWAEDIIFKYKVISNLKGRVETNSNRSLIEISNGRGYLYNVSDVINLYRELIKNHSGYILATAVFMRYFTSCLIKKVKFLKIKNPR
ncbi:glycosyltransferase family 2 protein [Shewanella chilikensis]|uniref:glycosyltransferase family 2 protein n=1 Tax=Shewanella chilikensis TaxID=558541 RepID=UPI00399A9F5B